MDYESVHVYLQTILDRWEEIIIRYDDQPLPILFAEVQDPQVQAAILVKMMIEKYELEKLEDIQEETLYASSQKQSDSGDGTAGATDPGRDSPSDVGRASQGGG